MYFVKIMEWKIDRVTMDVGAVGGLRNIKSAIKVARRVLENTKHSLLGGDLAAKFAIEMGFRNESLTTNVSHGMWEKWRAKNCQPNFWKVSYIFFYLIFQFRYQ